MFMTLLLSMPGRNCFVWGGGRGMRGIFFDLSAYITIVVEKSNFLHVHCQTLLQSNDKLQLHNIFKFHATSNCLLSWNPKNIFYFLFNHSQKSLWVLQWLNHFKILLGSLETSNVCYSYVYSSLSTMELVYILLLINFYDTTIVIDSLYDGATALIKHYSNKAWKISRNYIRQMLQRPL